ncbi:class I adenylate-forming enzyme family protein [Aquamicrobium defluvii]|uniref:3-methylmercaptopropionyl-CoA ligase n=1 Tax=Aquamicrobium defluvii TaxID=69279 RepID=A0A4R6YDG8_9HYPH|nr:AMP-binding protein [Aquamicrobium defluvii]TDR33931.1 AMP-binding enzyme [Aquamicrobium defluvii]
MCAPAPRHVVPPPGGFEPGEIISLSKRLRNVTFFVAPTVVRRLVEHAKAHGENGDGIKTIVYGGGPMYVADIEEAVAMMGTCFVQIYGQGESPMTITALSRTQIGDRGTPGWRDRLASVGMAQSCVELRIVDSEGATLSPGEVGEVIVAGPQVMTGYWCNDQATAATLRAGWLWTGDLGRLDEDGFLTLTDRSKDVIISGGSNIYPREVEEALLSYPGVAEASVVGRPHPDWGEEVIAFVVLAQGCDAEQDALDAHCLGHIARFKRPRHYVFVSGLPKNNYGKILKTELRERLKVQNDNFAD